MTNRQVILAARPQGMVQPGDFRLQESPVPPLQEGQFLIEVAYLSIDPAMRGWMKEGTTYVRGVEIGEVMRAFGAGTVLESRHPHFKAGDAVQGITGAQRYAVSDGTHIRTCDLNLAPPNWHLGILGMPGMTAYFGLFEKGKPQPGETILVSAAAGMVGSAVCQMARIAGCRVVGIAGGPEKCKYLLDIGCDAAIDYRQGNLIDQIRDACPKCINIYFDNVGGPTLDAALLHLAYGARIVVCGAMSQYNNDQPEGIRNYMKIVSARGTLTGIIVFDYYDRYPEAVARMGAWIKEGKLQYREHIVEGMENFAVALQMLFRGENKGKLILAV